MNIKSWVGQKVRIKREYLEYTADWDTEVYLSSEVPFRDFFNQQRCDDHSCGNAESWVGTVDSHYYGLFPSKNNEDIGEHTPSSQIVLKSLGDSYACEFAWDTKYFEVIKAVRVEKIEYQVDEEFK